MTINDWSQEQLRSFVQTLIDRKPILKELPQAPVAQVGQLLQFDGTEWQAVSNELTYNQITSSVTISATTEGTATVVMTASSVNYDGISPVMVEGFITDTSAIVSTSVAYLLWDDTAGVSLGQIGFVSLVTGALTQGPHHFARRITPAVGARIYSIRAFRGASNAAANAGAGTAGVKSPAFIRITKV